MLDKVKTFETPESQVEDRGPPTRQKDRLDTIADIVGLPRTYFTRGERATCALQVHEPDRLKTFLGLSGADELVSLFSQIDDPGIRRTIVSLVASIVRSGAGAPVSG